MRGLLPSKPCANVKKTFWDCLDLEQQQNSIDSTICRSFDSREAWDSQNEVKEYFEDHIIPVLSSIWGRRQKHLAKSKNRKRHVYNVAMFCWMVGANLASAVPTIVLVLSDKTELMILQDLIKEDDDIGKSGFAVEAKGTLFHTTGPSNMQLNDLYGLRVRIEGNSVTISDNKLVTTIGGPIYLDGEPYLLTAGHAFAQSDPTQAHDPDEEEFVERARLQWLPEDDASETQEIEIACFERSIPLRKCASVNKDWALVSLRSSNPQNIDLRRGGLITGLGVISQGMEPILFRRNTRSIQCSTVPSLISLPGSPSLHKAFYIQYPHGSRPIVNDGDSGLWVADEFTRQLYGIVVARYEGSGTSGGLILPATDVIQSILAESGTSSITFEAKSTDINEKNPMHNPHRNYIDDILEGRYDEAEQALQELITDPAKGLGEQHRSNVLQFLRWLFHLKTATGQHEEARNLLSEMQNEVATVNDEDFMETSNLPPAANYAQASGHNNELSGRPQTLDPDSSTTTVEAMLIESSQLDARLRYREAAKLRQKALVTAVELGSNDIVRALINRPDIITDKKYADGKTLLEIACEQEQLEIIELLFAHEDVNAQTWTSILPAMLLPALLLRAAAIGHTELVKRVARIDRVDIEITDDDGNTPLTLAAQFGHTETVRCLIEMEAFVHHENDYKCTPITCAAASAHIGTVQVLAGEMGMNEEDLLSFAARNGHAELLCGLLQQSEVDVKNLGVGGRAAWFCAVKNGWQPILELLIEHKEAYLDITDNDGRTALFWAAENDKPGVIRLLMQQKEVDVNSTDKEGHTPLCWAAAKGQHKVVGFLVEQKDVNLNVTDHEGRTALSWAAGNGWPEVVELLVKQKEIDLDIADNEGHTAMWWATNQNKLGTAYILRRVMTS